MRSGFERGEHMNAQKDTQEQSRQIAGVALGGRASIRLRGRDGSTEKGLDIIETIRDRFADFRIVRGKLKCQIDKHAAASVLMIKRVLNRLGDESPNCLLRPKGRFQASNASASEALRITLQ
jgi:hypothetical protein